MCRVSGSVAWVAIEKRRNPKRNDVSIGGKSETPTLIGLYTGQAPWSHQEIQIMESSQRTSGGFVRFFLESIACLLFTPSHTIKQLASPNNQFAPYASQHHLWFSEVRKDEDVQSIQWAEDQTTCQHSPSSLPALRDPTMGYFTSVCYLFAFVDALFLLIPQKPQQCKGCAKKKLLHGVVLFG